MRQFNRSLIATLILGASATPLVASDDWELLGSRRVSRAAERDAIEVTPREGRFNAIRIEVDGGAVQMYDVRVVFANGADFSPNTRLEFPDGASSRVLDLPGEARTIRRIVFRYKTSNPRGSLVRVYGRKADGGNEGPGNDPPPGADGWDHIGAAEVDFRTDRDVISGRGEG